MYDQVVACADELAAQPRTWFVSGELAVVERDRSPYVCRFVRSAIRRIRNSPKSAEHRDKREGPPPPAARARSQEVDGRSHVVAWPLRMATRILRGCPTLTPAGRTGRATS